MDQGIIAAFSVFGFICFMLGHYIGQSERRSRRSVLIKDINDALADGHRLNIEQRARSLQ